MDGYGSLALRGGLTRQCALLTFMVVLVIMSHARPAQAEDEPWKDGCPSKYAPEYLPNDLPGLPTHEGAGAFGTLPDIDDTLGPTRVAATAWSDSLTHQRMPDALPPNLIAGQGLIQLNAGATGVLAMVTWGAGGALSRNSPDSSYAHVGNLQAYVGYRSTSYWLRPAFRRGWAFRVGGGSAFAGNLQQLVNERQHMAVIAPFHTQLFGFDRPLSATLEYRIEMIGCHAPFLHARIDGETWQAQSGGGTAYPRVFVVPMSLAGGGYIYPWLTLYGQFGIEFRSPRSVMLFGHVSRTSLGVEFQNDSHHARFGLRGSAYTGDNARGLEFVITISWDHLWKGAQ